MTTTFAVDSNNDLYLDNNGNIAIISGLQATLQACQQAVQTTLGEMVLDMSSGLPYFQAVFVGNPNFKVFNSAATSAILAVDGVNQVISFTSSQDGDKLIYTAVILTVYGQGTITNG